MITVHMKGCYTKENVSTFFLFFCINKHPLTPECMERTSTSLWTNNTAHSNPDATRAAVGQSSLSELCKLFLICTTVTIITTLASEDWKS